MLRPHDITVAILAGGLGTRLRSVVADRPKVLATVDGRPFLAHWLDALTAAGFRQAVLCTGYLADQLENTLGGHWGELLLSYSPEPEPLGTGGALTHARPRLNSELTLVLNGDSFCDVDLNQVVSRHLTRTPWATMVITQVPDAGRYGRVRLGADARILGFSEKEAGCGPGWINAGIYLLSRAALDSLPSTPTFSLEREVLPDWIGRRLVAHPHRGRFIDIGTPASLAAAQGFFGASAPECQSAPTITTAPEAANPAFTSTPQPALV